MFFIWIDVDKFTIGGLMFDSVDSVGNWQVNVVMLGLPLTTLLEPFHNFLSLPEMLKIPIFFSSRFSFNQIKSHI